jgi:hypothetical protein
MANEIATATVDLKVEGPRMRIEAMAFAVRSMDESPEQVVKRAEAYYEFLKGGTS